MTFFTLLHIRLIGDLSGVTFRMSEKYSPKCTIAGAILVSTWLSKQVRHGVRPRHLQLLCVNQMPHLANNGTWLLARYERTSITLRASANKENRNASAWRALRRPADSFWSEYISLSGLTTTSVS